MIKKSLKSSFLSCEKDIEGILSQLFLEDGRDEKGVRYSESLKRLLIINEKDCLDNPKYKEIVDKYGMKKVFEDYFKIVPKVKREEHDTEKTKILISFDNFVPNGTNEWYRDCTIMIDIICPLDTWDLGNFRLRPLKIAGYIDGMLNGARLSGIGLLNFISCNELILNEELGGYCLMYRAVHGSDDIIPAR